MTEKKGENNQDEPRYIEVQTTDLRWYVNNQGPHAIKELQQRCVRTLLNGHGMPTDSEEVWIPIETVWGEESKDD